MAMTRFKKILLTATLGIVLGAVATTAIRFVSYKQDLVHYHANFALFINDERDTFKGPGFYEEIQACSSASVDNPRTRVHLHDENPGLVHVHAHGVIWSDLFANIGYGLSDKAITTPDAVYADGTDGNKLTFMLNGKVVRSIAGQLIKSEDKLLINYGNDDEAAIQMHMSTIPSDAHKANTDNDPSTCSGSKPLTFGSRMRIALGANPSR